MALIVTVEDGPPPEGYEDIYRPSFWHWGVMRRLWAWQYGLQAFKLRVRKGGPRRIPPDRLKTKRGSVATKRGKAPKRPTKKRLRK